ncbi:hypothetical protein QYM36_014407 [Artemia franciscana]|uniref:Uncharacterized protein n=1 Tax=Artemia franciscana TaxID=6661 RepID=A0AA88HNH4_ARTSF|nr:hypothetical protein QYM36_014407 [Artemia franciscana]
MASGELVYLPVLNFLQFSRNNGVGDDLIIRHALEFFDAAAVAAAKSAFWKEVLPGEICPRRAGNKATQSHLRDILELLAKCDSQDLTVPTYVILSANEVPSVPDLMFSHLSSKLTRMEQVINAVASRAEVYDNHFPPIPQPTEPNVPATVVISKIPASLENPLKRKEILDKVTGHECVSSIKAQKDQLIVHIDKSAVNVFCSSIKNTVTSCETKTVTKKKYLELLNEFLLTLMLNSSAVSQA